MTPEVVLAAARAWRDEDPDPDDRAEVDRLLAQAERGGADTAAALDELRDRFGARLEFGTAGLRGEMGAGPNRMNRAVAIRASAGLAAYLADTGHAGEPVMVGYDARHRSAGLAAEAAAVFAGAGFPVKLGDRPLPTPLVAFGVTHLECCAGVQITASHNPPADNGYKVYLGDGAQIAPPVDRAISDRIAAVGPLGSVPRAALDDPRIQRVGGKLVDAYVTGAVSHVVGPGDSPSAAASPEVDTGSGTAPAGDPGQPSAAREAGDAERSLPAAPSGGPSGVRQSPAGGGDGGFTSAADRRDIRVVYTPLHGVGRDVLLTVFERAGFQQPHVVAAQADPDPDFPTVAFPNPEEPGALDLALAAADELDADVILANDPDADRLAVVVPASGAQRRRDSDGSDGVAGAEAGGAGTTSLADRPRLQHGPRGGDVSHRTGQDGQAGANESDEMTASETTGETSDRRWRVLTGDEIGVLLADWLLERGAGADRLVVTTVVSSSMLGRLAAARGVVFAETLTGFKWIARAAFDRADLRFVFGYEEALGSCVGTLVRDKDGITAALAMAELVAFERRRSRSVLDRLDDLARELGVHATGQRSLRFRGIDGAARMRQAVDRLASAPPTVLDGRPVTQVEDLRAGERLPPTDGVVLRADGLRLIVRPSGTEPKLKCYAEAVVPVGRDTDLRAAQRQGASAVAALLVGATDLVG